jgi:hypothetical protein
MTRLSTALSIESTDERVAVYWDALCDLPLAAVVFACQHATRYWRPTPEERKPFPLPATLRDYAGQYRQEQRQQEAAQARQHLPQWSSTPDAIGVQAIRTILQLLDKQTDMDRVVPRAEASGDPLHYEPTVDPDEAKARLREQFRLLRDQEGA